MCMQKRHFEIVAEVIKETRALFGDNNDALGVITMNFADRFQELNPRFNRGTFLAACGYVGGPGKRWPDDYPADRRIADRIDGYDRDDLGESPDY